MAKVVHCKRENFDVYIGRPGPFGNPFKIGRDGNRQEVVEKYAEWVLTQPELLAKIKAELKDKVLGCWCKTEKNPDALCHGDILVELANEYGPIAQC